jgi:hypothetical protein
MKIFHNKSWILIFSMIGLRSSMNSMNSGQSPNDSEVSASPGQQSIILPFDNNPSTQSLSQNHSAISSSDNLLGKRSFHSRLNKDKANSTSMEYINEIPINAKQHRSINLNAITEHRQYKITVLHSDEALELASNKCKIVTEVILSNSLLTTYWMFYLVYQTASNCTEKQIISSNTIHANGINR